MYKWVISAAINVESVLKSTGTKTKQNIKQDFVEIAKTQVFQYTLADTGLLLNYVESEKWKQEEKKKKAIQIHTDQIKYLPTLNWYSVFYSSLYMLKAIKSSLWWKLPSTMVFLDDYHEMQTGRRLFW